MNKVNIKDSQNFITSKYHIEKIIYDINNISFEQFVSLFNSYKIFNG